MSQPKKYWLDNPANVTKLYRLFWILCLLLIASDFFIHRHEDFEFATLFGFHVLYGFLGCAVLILAAKQLRRLLMRDEDYYDR